MSEANRQPMDYEATGVSTRRAGDGLTRLTRRVLSTWPQGPGTGTVHLPLGQYANVVEIAGQGIAFSTDGVGSKALVAQMLGRYDTIGIDCIAMNVNDLICVGATPVSLVDYIAVETADADMLDEISIGLVEGARQAGISISGGEIAQLPGMIHGTASGHGFDLVGAAIGHVALDRIITGRDIVPGDVIIGVESNGIHSNGLTLARGVFGDGLEAALGESHGVLDVALGEELLKPTHIYVPEALEVMEKVPGVKALVHITSDGFLNLCRMEATVAYVIDRLLPVPPIFELIQDRGSVDEAEMFQVYNMGTAFCFVAASEDAGAIVETVRAHGRNAAAIGHVEASDTKRVRIEERGLIGEGKRFRDAG